MSQLSNDDTFPTIRGQSVSGGTMAIPVDLDAEWVTVLFYRGEW